MEGGGKRCVRQGNGPLNIFDLHTIVVMSIGEDGKFDVWVTVMLVHGDFIRDGDVFDVGIACQPFVTVVDFRFHPIDSTVEEFLRVVSGNLKVDSAVNNKNRTVYVL